jgi:hypothetical protein
MLLTYCASLLILQLLGYEIISRFYPISNIRHTEKSKRFTEAQQRYYDRVLEMAKVELKFCGTSLQNYGATKPWSLMPHRMKSETPNSLQKNGELHRIAPTKGSSREKHLKSKVHSFGKITQYLQHLGHRVD